MRQTDIMRKLLTRGLLICTKRNVVKQGRTYPTVDVGQVKLCLEGGGGDNEKVIEKN